MLNAKLLTVMLDKMQKEANIIEESVKGATVHFGLTENDKPNWCLEILKDGDLRYWIDADDVYDLANIIDQISLGVRLATGKEA